MALNRVCAASGPGGIDIARGVQVPGAGLSITKYAFFIVTFPRNAGKSLCNPQSRRKHQSGEKHGNPGVWHIMLVVNTL